MSSVKMVKNFVQLDDFESIRVTQLKFFEL